MAGSGVNDFLISKWRQAFKFLNVNRDGVLVGDDFQTLADNISRKSNATPEQTAKTREEWMKWFRFMQPDPSVIVDEDRFLASGAELYEQDLNRMKILNVKTASDLFDRLDLDGRGSISLKEFTIFYEAAGFKNVEIIKRNFSQMDKNSDGWIEREEFVDDSVRFYTDPDAVTGKAFIFAWDKDS